MSIGKRLGAVAVGAVFAAMSAHLAAGAEAATSGWRWTRPRAGTGWSSTWTRSAAPCT